ncbi:MAG: citrate synthase [Planctomycetota bacterium]
MPKELIPGLEGVPIAESSVSFVDGQKGRLEYRGISVEDLAEHSTFEETSFLLLHGRLPTQQELDEFEEGTKRFRRLKFRIIDLIKCLPETGHPMDALQAAIAAIGMFYPPRHHLTKDDQLNACLRLIAKAPTVVAAFERLRTGDDQINPRHDLSLAGNFLYMMNGKVPDPEHERILGIALILHADHTMNASTFSGRVVGSTLADPYCVISSALGALSGPLHGGANEQAMALFNEIGRPENVRPIIEKMIENKEKIPGFGHRVYKTLDPRAKILKVHAQKLAQKSGNPLYDVAVEVEKVVGEHYSQKGIWPNVDFFSGIVYSELGIPTDCFTPVFAIARVSGWLAHWLEQLDGNRIYRPTQIYVGEHNATYRPIDQR